jgi:hypothetical protein
MVWFFERGMEMAILEVRRKEREFEFALRLTGGKEEIEILPTPNDLFARLERVPTRCFPQVGGPSSTCNRSVRAEELRN